jgi:cell division protein FtsB
MTDSLIIEILLGVLAVMIGVGSFVGATRATKVQAVGMHEQIEAGAYERATNIYEGAIASMEAQLSRLRTEIADLDREVVKLRESNRLLSVQVTELSTANHQLLTELGRNGYHGPSA